MDTPHLCLTNARFNMDACAAPCRAHQDRAPLQAVPPGDSLSTLLAERQKTHGDYGRHACVTQAIKRVFQAPGLPGALALDDSQKESLDMIAHKIGRILAGDPNHEDHWRDIAGYATLVADRLLPVAPEVGN